MARWQTLATLAFPTMSLLSCGKEVGRLPFTGEGPGETTATLQAGDVSFWTDIDLAYEGNASLAYQVELVQNGATVASAVCNPLADLHVKTRWTETNLGESHTRRGQGKMACQARLANGGPTTVKATLAFEHRPASMTLKRADLLLKQ